MSSDRAYRIYLGAAVALVVLVPLLRLAMLAVGDPFIVAWWQSGKAESAVTSVALLLLAGLCQLGAARGPVVGPPLRIHLLASGRRPRRKALRPLLIRHLLAAVGSAVLVCGVFAGGLLLADAMSIPQAGLLLLASAGLGVLALVTWLAGQALENTARGSLSLVLVASAAIAPLWGAILGRGIPVLLIGVASVAAITVIPRLLDALRGPVIDAQSRAWERGMSAAAGGEVATGLSSFSPVPGIGRRFFAIRGRNAWGRALLRDAAASLRTPARLLTGVILLAVAGALFVVIPAVPWNVAWALAAAAGVALFFGLGPLVDGFRFAAEAAAAPALLGTSDGRLLLQHSAFPVLLGLLLIGGIAWAAGAGPGPLGAVCIAVSLRARDAVKGPLPAKILTPMPTAAGDISAVRILFWQADALIAAAATGMAAVLLPAPTFLALTPVAVLVLALGTRARMRA